MNYYQLVTCKFSLVFLRDAQISNIVLWTFAAGTWLTVFCTSLRYVCRNVRLSRSVLCGNFLVYLLATKNYLVLEFFDCVQLLSQCMEYGDHCHLWLCLYVCVCVCQSLCVCVAKGKQLELSTPNLVHIYSRAVTLHALTWRSNGQDHVDRKIIMVPWLLVAAVLLLPAQHGAACCMTA